MFTCKYKNILAPFAKNNLIEKRDLIATLKLYMRKSSHIDAILATQVFPHVVHSKLTLKLFIQRKVDINAKLV
jgi:hypothetical protein